MTRGRHSRRSRRSRTSRSSSSYGTVVGGLSLTAVAMALVPVARRDGRGDHAEERGGGQTSHRELSTATPADRSIGQHPPTEGASKGAGQYELDNKPVIGRQIVKEVVLRAQLRLRRPQRSPQRLRAAVSVHDDDTTTTTTTTTPTERDDLHGADQVRSHRTNLGLLGGVNQRGSPGYDPAQRARDRDRTGSVRAHLVSRVGRAVPGADGAKRRGNVAPCR